MDKRTTGNLSTQAFIPKAMITQFVSGRSSGSPLFLMPSLPVTPGSGCGSERIKGLQLRVQLRNYTGFPINPDCVTIVGTKSVTNVEIISF